jgi:hypothetical protein
LPHCLFLHCLPVDLAMAVHCGLYAETAVGAALGEAKESMKPMLAVTDNEVKSLFMIGMGLDRFSINIVKVYIADSTNIKVKHVG